MLQPQILEKPELKVVGMETPFISGLSPQTTNFQVIPPLWGAFVRRHAEIANHVGKEMYGIIYGKPADQRSHPDELQYIAGVAVSSAKDIPQGMVSRTIPAGTFACVTHRGPIRKIRDTIFELYRVWLPQSGFEHAGIADVELYDDRFNPDSDESEFDYWISVKRK
jgi:AraC family transcriptional regulator